MEKADRRDQTQAYGAMTGVSMKDYYAQMVDYHQAWERLCVHLKEAHAAYHEHSRNYHSQMMEHYRKLMG